MPQAYDQYGRPLPKSSAPLIVGLCVGFALILLVTLYATGSLDRMFGKGASSGTATNVTASANVTAPAAAPAPATQPAATPAQPKAAPAAQPVTAQWLAGTWCVVGAEYEVRYEFTLAGGLSVRVNGEATTATLNGNLLSLGASSDPPTPVTRNGDNAMTWTYPSGVTDRLRRC